MFFAITASEMANVSRTELDELGASVRGGSMSRWHVERLAGSAYFVMVGVVNCHLSLEHISPVWALAAVVGRPFSIGARSASWRMVTKLTV